MGADIQTVACRVHHWELRKLSRSCLDIACWLCAAYQNAVREQRMAAEISAATRERDFYLSRVDKAKGIAAIKERKAKQQGQVASADVPLADEAAATPKPLRMYGQRKAKVDPVLDPEAPMLSPDVLAMLGSRIRSG